MTSPNRITVSISSAQGQGVFPFTSFDGSTGHISTERRDLVGFADCSIFTADRTNAIWSGIGEISESHDGLIVALCVQSIQTTAQNDVIPWKNLPGAFDVFDGGYRAMTVAEIESLLDDLITFSSQATTLAHLHAPDGYRCANVRITDQSQLVQLRELFIETDSIFAAKRQSIVVLAVELFEVSYFVVTVCNDQVEQGAFLGLTRHFYIATRRNGRRLKIPNVQLGTFTATEVSDFGLQVVTQNKNADDRETLDIQLPDGEKVPFKVVYRKEEGTQVTLGLFLAEDSPQIRTSWQRFVTHFYYPNLRWRTASDHDALWQLYEKTGYFGQSPVDNLLRECRPSIQREWSNVDDAGPWTGTTVIGSTAGVDAGTIGVNRLGETLWSAQAAAMVNEPKHLEVTRSIYSWRTRAILLQPDGQYHVAVFDRDKPFLDRFFRKFYLANGAASCTDISWSEWRVYFSWNTKPQNERIWTTPSSTALTSSETLIQLIASSGGGVTSVAGNEEAQVTVSRPHVHICQFFTGVWCHTSDVDASALINKIPSEHPFFAVYSRHTENIASLATAGFDLVDNGEMVVWTCTRRLLPFFQSNSLRSLEMMLRKYGSRRIG